GCVKTCVRKEELFARYGGEEFIIVLPETNLEGAIIVAERLRSLIEKHAFQYEGKSYPLTVSVGVAATNGDRVLSPSDLIGEADEKLFDAKREGRNRVIA